MTTTGLSLYKGHPEERGSEGGERQWREAGVCVRERETHRERERERERESKRASEREPSRVKTSERQYQKRPSIEVKGLRLRAILEEGGGGGGGLLRRRRI